MPDWQLGGQGSICRGGPGAGPSYLLTHLLLFGRVGLDVLAEGAGVRVALGAARDLTGVWLLKHQRGRGGMGEGPPARPRVLPCDLQWGG